MSQRSVLNMFINYEKREDNVTHGFLSLLQCLEPQTSKTILQQILPDISFKKNIVYDIQTPTLKNKQFFRNSNYGHVLGISSIGTDFKEDISEKKESRADGWIGDGHTLILIEAKVGSKFSEDQFKRHERNLSNYCRNTSIPEPITWQRIDSVLKTIQNLTALTETEAKLIADYRRYLQMEGITLDFEKFYNATRDDIEKYWVGAEPKTTLQELKLRLRGKIDQIDMSDEQTNQTRMNYYWLRLFQEERKGIDWRGTIYLDPDAVSVDLLAFYPNKRDIENIIEKIHNIADKQNEDDNLRTWIYVSSYGKRRNVQSGRDYDYCKLNYNLVRGPKNFWKHIIEFARVIAPKQIGIKYSISNPGTFSETYWLHQSEGDNINSKDAKLLQNPEELIDNFANFLQLALAQIIPE